MHLHSRWILLVIVGLFCSYAVWAGITGSISGLVTDPSGAVVSGAQVVATETQTHLRTERSERSAETLSPSAKTLAASELD
jgi:hypothetical protein